MMASLMLRGLWTYRGFVLGSVAREFRALHGNTGLGALWSLLSPLAMILVYTVVSAEVMRTRLPGSVNVYAYSIYLCAGILAWGLFAEIVARAQTMFIDQANLLKKINFPRICLPLSVVLGALLNFAIIFALFTVFLIATGNFPGAVFATIAPAHVRHQHAHQGPGADARGARLAGGVPLSFFDAPGRRNLLGGHRHRQHRNAPGRQLRVARTGAGVHRHEHAPAPLRGLRLARPGRRDRTRSSDHEL